MILSGEVRSLRALFAKEHGATPSAAYQEAMLRLEAAEAAFEMGEGLLAAGREQLDEFVALLPRFENGHATES